MSAQATEFKTAAQILDEERAVGAARTRTLDVGPDAKDGAKSVALKEREIELAYQVTGPSIPVAQLTVLRNAVCPKLSSEQFLLYVVRCVRKGVDMFDQAYAFPNRDGGLAMGLKIDGMRDLAMRTGAYVSRKVETLFDPTDTEKRKPIGARCEIRRKGMEEPIVEEAYLSEYDASRWSDQALIWKRMPETMIRKVAESKALRAAFPDALAGVYEPAEIHSD